MASTDSDYDISSMQRELSIEFEKLLQRFPGAAGRFVLADLGYAGDLSALRARFQSLEPDCVSTPFGLICKPIEQPT